MILSDSPHYLLFSEAGHNRQHGRAWRFVLQNLDTSRRFSAADCEPIDCGERLELLAVVRGLEAIEVPSRVTLVTKSRYVSRGLKFGLAEWRASGWRWERFGKLVAVKDHDLWRRVDHALRFHRVECQSWQFEGNEFEDTKDDRRSANRMSAAAIAESRRTRLSVLPRKSPSRPKAALVPVVNRRAKRRVDGPSDSITAAGRFLAGTLKTAADRWRPASGAMA